MADWANVTILDHSFGAKIIRGHVHYKADHFLNTAILKIAFFRKTRNFEFQPLEKEY